MATLPLHTVLNNISQELADLEQTLRDEFLALSGNEFDGIELAAQNKNQHFDTLERLEQQRCQLLQQDNFDLGSKGVMAYIDHYAHTSELHNEITHSWQEIENRTENCRRHNKINGIILEKNRQRTERALSILKGQSPDACATYTSTGQTSRTQQSHSSIKV